MPFRTSRGSRQGRPRPSFRTTGFPSNGSMTFHSASVRSAMRPRTNTPALRWKAPPNHGAISITYPSAHLWDGLYWNCRFPDGWAAAYGDRNHRLLVFEARPVAQKNGERWSQFSN